MSSAPTAPQEPTRIRRVLIANRGEVVIRISRTLRFMGIESVAIFTDADASAPFTKATDAAVPLGGTKNYLKIPVVVAAGKRAKCDAVHPGYGFLAENADFAQAVKEAGMIFIGPSAESIRALGSKSEAKRLLNSTNSGVPTIPGFLAAKDQQASMKPDDWKKAAAEKVGYPVLIKAAAGGGGKGMRVVRDPKDFLPSFDAVITEAKGAFGDSTVLLERYFDDVRHIEVQVLGDQHGGVTHLFERECSIQRRHQKLLEECPAASLPLDLRAKICDAAVRVGKSVKYENAGTVEFIVNGKTGVFYFLEVNTRLQVEHAVTELCTGVDIVSAQLRIAEGMPVLDAIAASPRRSDVYGTVLPQKRPPPQATGFAIEARVYAEDDNFAPSVGTITTLAESRDVEYHTTVAPGTSVGVHYDGLLTKVIAYSTTSRTAAVDALFTALRSTVIFGVQQANRKALMRLLQHPLVVTGDMATNLIDKGTITREYLRAPLPSKALDAAPSDVLNAKQRDCAFIAAAVGTAALARRSKVARRPAGPWRAASSGWSNTGTTTSVAPRVLVASHDRDLSFRVALQHESCSNADPSHYAVAERGGSGVEDDAAADVRFIPTWDAETPAKIATHPGSTGLNFVAITHVGAGGQQIVSEVAATQICPAEATLWQPDDKEQPVLEMVHVHLFESGNSFSFGVVDRHAGYAAVSRPPTGSLLPATYGHGSSTASAAAALAGEGAAASGDGGDGAGGDANATAVRSPIPAKVVRAEVSTGATVTKGQTVVVLESMKMETKVAAPCDGTVAIKVKPGDLVQGNRTLFTVTAADAKK